MEFGNPTLSSLQILSGLMLLILLLYNVALTVAGGAGFGGFVSVQRRPGERDIMIRLDGISAMETATGENLGADVIDYIYREITDGTHLIQSVYDDEYQLRSCQITDDEHKIRHLFIKQQEISLTEKMKQQKHSFSKAHAKSITPSEPNLHISVERNSEASTSQVIFTKSDLELKHNIDKFQYSHNATDSVYFQFNGPVEILPHPVNTMLDMAKMKRDCEKYHQDIMDNYYQQHPQKIGGRYQRATDHEEDAAALSRKKRGLSFTWPGTLWCGKGTLAKTFGELGEHAFTDRCCRDHDHCPSEWIILGRETKYHLYNRNFFTISHCKCDKMVSQKEQHVKTGIVSGLHRCLRQTQTTVSNEVGNTYFNRFSIHCFVFKEKEQCVERSWWGTCTRYEHVSSAVLRDGHAYPKSIKRQAREAEMSIEQLLEIEKKDEERAAKRAEAEQRRYNKTMVAEERQLQKEESAQRKEAKQAEAFERRQNKTMAAEARQLQTEESAQRKEAKQAEALERRENKTMAAEARQLLKEESARRKEIKQAEAIERRENKTIAADARQFQKEMSALRKELKQAAAEERRRNKTLAFEARQFKKEERALRKDTKQAAAFERRERKKMAAEERYERKNVELEGTLKEEHVVDDMDIMESDTQDTVDVVEGKQEPIQDVLQGGIEITRVHK